MDVSKDGGGGWGRTRGSGGVRASAGFDAGTCRDEAGATTGRNGASGGWAGSIGRVVDRVGVESDVRHYGCVRVDRATQSVVSYDSLRGGACTETVRHVGAAMAELWGQVESEEVQQRMMPRQAWSNCAVHASLAVWCMLQGIDLGSIS